jgi:signal transduction histidine kinase/ligand-binding sensor domain-containing protein
MKFAPSSRVLDASHEHGRIVKFFVPIGPTVRSGSTSVAALHEQRCASVLCMRLLSLPFWRGCVLVLFLAATAWAVDPHTLISQYGHTAWRVQDGYFTGQLAPAITQTADGYIWVGTNNGLMRFDGVNFTPWIAPRGQSLPRITDLLGGRDGSLWIGTPTGLVRLKGGELFSYSPKPNSPGISEIIEDKAGAIWVTRYRVHDGMGPLCRVTGTTLQCYGVKDGGPYGLGLAEDSSGSIWFGCEVLCRWSPNSSSVYFKEQDKNPAGNGVIAVAAGPAGSVWASLDGTGPGRGVRYFSNGKWDRYVVPGFDGETIRSRAMFVDRNQTLWVGTENKGLYRIHDGSAEHYGSANGLSGDHIGSISEDKEGNLWVLTDRGIDFFRDIPVVTFSANEGLVGAKTDSVLALSNGSVLVGNSEALDTIHAGAVSAISAGHGLPGHDVYALFEDRIGKIWLGLDNNVMTYNLGHFNPIKNANGALVKDVGSALAFAQDVDRNIWALTYVDGEDQFHLLRFNSERLEANIPMGKIMNGTRFLAADREGGVWILARDGKLARYQNGKADLITSFESTANSLFVDSENVVWGATSKGLYRWKDGSLNVMNSSNGLPCSTLYSMVKDNYGSVWLYAECGLLKISASDWTHWLEFPASKVAVKTFDTLDGVQSANGTPEQPIVSKSTDGRLWFASDSFVQMVDPDRTYNNLIPPPVHIQQLVADHKSYNAQGQLSLPPLKGELEIDYTALSFTVPRRVHFRYKLDGHDKEWHDPGTRRQAFYNDLGPGKYRFQVIACNNDGVWNQEGAILEFSIAPAWYQTSWFRLLCAVAVVLVVWVVYRLRVRQIAQAMSTRFDERLAERTRMARDLHDTFLQTIQGSKLVADDALDPSTDPARMRPAMEQLSVWLGRATDEGRAALNSLRTSTTEKNDLAAAFRRAMEECRIHSSMKASLSVVGEVREMHPIVRDEVYRIGFEAIRNACVHSKASQLQVELIYDHDLALRINDDGVGIDPAVGDRGREGHFGLQGMQERAVRIAGKLTVASSANSGTEIKLVVPGGIIYRKTTSVPQGLPARIKLLFNRMGLTSNPTDIER